MNSPSTSLYKYGLIMSLPMTIFFAAVTVSVSALPSLQPESIFTASRMLTNKIYFCTFPFFISPSCILQALLAVLPLINSLKILFSNLPPCILQALPAVLPAINITQKYTKTRQQINSCELLVDRSVIPEL